MLDPIGTEVLGVILVGMSLETVADQCSWRANDDGFILVFCIVCAALNTDVPHDWMKPWMDELRVILPHNPLLDDGSIFVLLGKSFHKYHEKPRQGHLLNKTLEDGDTWLRVEGCQREAEHVDKHMQRAEQAHEL